MHPSIVVAPVDLDRGETIAMVRDAVLSLPGHYREVVVLCDLQEMSYEEAALVLECAVGTVRSRLHRARTLLTEKLSELQSAESKSAAGGMRQ
jgi:RNA polymerase sigma-70 factor (ECF subfamily)